MSKNSIISILLIIVSIVVHSIVSINNLNFKINPENFKHVAFAIGSVIPGIIFAVISGLAIALLCLLFPKNRSRNRFFLIFSIFFLLTILTATLGSYENKKIEQTKNNTQETQYLNRPYISNTYNFKINFPGEPKINKNDFLDVKGNTVTYSSTAKINGLDVTYFVIIVDTEELSSRNYIGYEERMSFYENLPLMGLAEAGANVTKISSVVKKVFKNNEGAEYKYKLEADGDVFYKKGIDFIFDKKGWEISLIYPLNLEGQIEEIYSNFVSSFNLGI